MVGQKVAHGLTTMPGRTVKEKQYRLRGKNRQEVVEKVKGGVGVHRRQGQSDLLAGMQGQCSVPVQTIPLRTDQQRWALPPGIPHALQGRLQVQAHFLHCQDDSIGMILLEISHFFSASASKSAISAWLGRER